ncbi:DUF1566 domain-containing protein [Polaribacter glomeratus]|uniref:DUF1566 domain-containing protein n=1 Tax=Polaribacter glomeratus TaxID=102 RepID=A0A2S7WF93_9FLAO|nr:DUF1566 domain-containing protein [Polaribacter glomeratus]PQJ76298.1 hypothetical protein BTO16_10275 [Polaribacter glomeratus]TXD65431.1 DUF1566 domain-containing protein [Polaribacter glomeratus]
MKKIFLISMLAISAICFSQTPEKMSYQAIVRNADGNLVSNQSVGIQISILKGTLSGAAIYVESHSVTTNVNGLVTIEIGFGGKVTGDFSTIEWGADKYFIKTETDPTGATNYTISGTSQLLSVPYALHAKAADNVPNYQVGDFLYGGVVFWVDETGQHGLVCSKKNQINAIKWFAGTFGSTQAKGNGLYAGKANNSIIISTHVILGDDGELYAARLCNELEITENNRTYGDWYLPSKFELYLMYENKEIINLTAIANEGESFVNDVYWSSTENSVNDAWGLDLSNGQESIIFKSFANNVRAIRSF